MHLLVAWFAAVVAPALGAVHPGVVVDPTDPSLFRFTSNM